MMGEAVGAAIAGEILEVGRTAASLQIRKKHSLPTSILTSIPRMPLLDRLKDKFLGSSS
jgi:hypothetical protein